MGSTSFIPFPILSTPRLQLKELSEGDVKTVFNLRSDPDINKYIVRIVPKGLDEAKVFITERQQEHITGKGITWAIHLECYPTMIGSICLWNFNEARTTADVGYSMTLAHQGKGYMSEALRAVLVYGKEDLGLASIHAYTHEDNKASRALLERYGFGLQSVADDKKAFYKL